MVAQPDLFMECCRSRDSILLYVCPSVRLSVVFCTIQLTALIVGSLIDYCRLPQDELVQNLRGGGDGVLEFPCSVRVGEYQGPALEHGVLFEQLTSALLHAYGYWSRQSGLNSRNETTSLRLLP